MGELGWTYLETIATPPYLITAALNARRAFIGEILKAVFGEGEPDAVPDPEPARKLSPALFDALFAGRK